METDREHIRRLNTGEIAAGADCAICMSTMQIEGPLPVIARIDCCGENFTLHSLTSAGQIVIYRGVEYSVAATGEPDVWQWRFQIGERSAAGKTRTRLVHMAARRVHMRIDAELRASRMPQHRDDRKT
jgi:hypothetical protein